MQDLRLFYVASAMSRLASETLRAYEQWAPLYPPRAHNPLMRAEERHMLKHWPVVQAGRTLDLASGSGRYSRLLKASGASEVIALDNCAPMVSQVDGGMRVRADMMRLPFAGGEFQAVICGLALGHAPDLGAFLGEIARVLAPGGVLLYSDFHPQASRANMTRSFSDSNQRTWTVPHREYGVAEQREALARSGFDVEIVDELCVGRELDEAFRGSEEFYARWPGLPIVLIIRARKS
jgi:malonyl-CoA O-methyltransferase